MIKCENCGILTSSNTRTHRIPVEYRVKRYDPFHEYTNLFLKPCNPVKLYGPSKVVQKRSKKKKPNKPTSDSSIGFEIVREMTVCSNCVDLVKVEPPL